jgi:hypothetical protein
MSTEITGEVVDSARDYVVTPQAPIHSGFGPDTTAMEVFKRDDLTGAIVVSKVTL